MPLGRLRIYQEIGEQLWAQERLDAIVDGACAAGNMKRQRSMSHQKRLEHVANRGRESKPATPDDLEALGIRVVKFSELEESA